MITKTEQVRAACAILAQHADLVANDLNAVGTLEGLAGRYQRAAVAAARDQEAAPLDPETIYASRRAAIAQRRAP